MVVPLNALIVQYINDQRPQSPQASKLELMQLARAAHPGIPINAAMWQYLGGSSPVSGYPAAVLADAPLGYWRLDDPSGTVAANIGTGAGPATYETGGTGGIEVAAVPRTPAAVASGLAITMKGAPNPQITQITLPAPAFGLIDFTCELWFRPAPTHAATGYLFNAIFADGQPQINLQVIINADGSLTAHRRNVAGVLATLNAPPVTLGAWHHLVYVRRAGISLALYLDGAVVASMADTPAGVPAAAQVTVGGDPSGARFTNGMLDEIAVYPTALTPTRIAAHYAARTS